MALLTTISGIPLFSTVQEALAWAIANGLSGYHTHFFNGQVGYMGGTNHSTAVGRNINSGINTASSTSPSPSPSPSPSSGGSGGGY
tara:strand:+ start:658 stop:915 length:258 start_codon:yes stop_codon:yes gene_type:complete